ncbi:uncharacterized protein ACLA_097660 [Aspergillus clavatus NRRL 1]|uniref:Serine hydrolase domain-containing protein n=1 Tax=Aspergillus clavatus (strain ATCC 1007 / CBS 513.65 / DSM 816 / NCTC 3887 / NRRL 1 / QM 1276 / 107) TaxID=344612 RepID=A1CMN8_ASPCL|nr:uncharacterized protein ACLA_097660 [Aspergillus clavatus NRRL 1]EAW08825.1 hypothetical protein ACLA_097660 [Aspergillus clavatus NRRL 1]
MRFLCLHGAGTSAEASTGGIIQELESKGHKFVFVDGRVNSKPEPEIEGILDGPFYSHYPRDVYPGEDLARAFEYTLNIMEKQGPFDGVMGFSQGAALTCALLAHHAKTNSTPLFKVAVFICAAKPFESSGNKELVAEEGQYPVSIPTTHIVGKQDPYYSSSMHLYGLCDPSTAVFYDHGSKHHIPFDQKNTSAMTAAIEQSIERAMKG